MYVFLYWTFNTLIDKCYRIFLYFIYVDPNILMFHVAIIVFWLVCVLTSYFIQTLVIGITSSIDNICTMSANIKFLFFVWALQTESNATLWWALLFRFEPSTNKQIPLSQKLNEKQKYHTKEAEAKYIPIHYVYCSSLTWLGTGTSIKRCWVHLDLLARHFPSYWCDAVVQVFSTCE